MTLPLPSIVPLDPSTIGSGVDIGARVLGVDLNSLPDDHFNQIETALYRYKVLIIPNQGDLDPEKQFEFVRRFDPTAAVRCFFFSLSLRRAELTRKGRGRNRQSTAIMMRLKVLVC